MSRARVFVNKIPAGILEKIEKDNYRFSYDANYEGSPVSLTMPIKQQVYEFNQFPPFFEFKAFAPTLPTSLSD